VGGVAKICALGVPHLLAGRLGLKKWNLLSGPFSSRARFHGQMVGCPLFGLGSMGCGFCPSEALLRPDVLLCYVIAVLQQSAVLNIFGLLHFGLCLPNTR